MDRDSLLSPVKFPTVAVTLPVRGVPLLVRTLSDAERGDFETANWRKVGKTRELDVEKLKLLRARMVVATVVNDAGVPVFKPDDVQLIADGWPAPDTEAVFKIACQLNGFTDNDVSELAKN